MKDVHHVDPLVGALASVGFAPMRATQGHPCLRYVIRQRGCYQVRADLHKRPGDIPCYPPHHGSRPSLWARATDREMLFLDQLHGLDHAALRDALAFAETWALALTLYSSPAAHFPGRGILAAWTRHGVAVGNLDHWRP